MARFCSLCIRSFPTHRGLAQHRARYHCNPKPRQPESRKKYHGHLSGRPCDANGQAIPVNVPPPPRDNSQSCDPFPNRVAFEFVEHLYEKAEESESDVAHLLEILKARDVLYGVDGIPSIFHNSDQFYATLDAITLGQAKWKSVALRYTGVVDENSPAWMKKSYVVHFRDTLEAVKTTLASSDFDGHFHTAPFVETVTLPSGEKTRRISDFMSAQWASRQAISKLPGTADAMLTPIILGADKTTVSVATGNQEFHPLYMSIGNITNEMRRAHREAVLPIGFLAIPKGDRDVEDSEEFRVFKKQLYHHAIAFILSPLRPGMTTPEVVVCPDGHYRRAIFELGPFIADYPEQVYLSGVVYGWCPKCLALPDELEQIGDPRFRALTDHLCAHYDRRTLWESFGVVGDVTPFTDYFPRADIHELLSPDLLHQLIKGTFKDHIVAWVEDYICITSDTAAEAKRILDDIDRRIAAVPLFPGLRRFPQGRHFKQWTGNDSKALMKVFLPAIVGYVPDKMVRCIAVLLDFTYLARRSSHTTQDLRDMKAMLAEFHRLRGIFEEVGVRPEGFSLPRQHALVHYVRSIQLFGSPNGLCSSITESRHITAVKKPWRRSNRRTPLAQILQTLVRLSKLAALRVDLARRGVLQSSVYHHALRAAGLDDEPDPDQLVDARYRYEADAAAAEDPYSMSSHLADELSQPRLLEHCRRFLRDTLYPELEPAVDVPLDECPELSLRTRVAVYHSARAVFYAPSEAAGPGGMHQEFIRCTPSWYGGPARYDTVLVQTNPDMAGLSGMTVARVRAFLSFVYEGVRHPCALVEWFELEDVEPDPVTGMWVVKPEREHGERVSAVIPVDSIVRACHLIGVYGRTKIPIGFKYSESLDAFRRYYVNWFVDYHAHETVI
ncbi:hypothetical protein K466DRAFT_505488 [Polyporus arcularius HHB13444]|uniref:C2H2-type domain-containing protein n=1 Tax=Polyporus arcularius HHB13444 TaxID=1314778 RepID=A0A5C3P141_9APHY|nr:hypothetical protein K466DRAFT_505488 [Polyporus arcularius HHB13444]